jgi:hypothetical protein
MKNQDGKKIYVMVIHNPDCSHRQNNYSGLTFGGNLEIRDLG